MTIEADTQKEWKGFTNINSNTNTNTNSQKEKKKILSQAIQIHLERIHKLPCAEYTDTQKQERMYKKTRKGYIYVQSNTNKFTQIQIQESQ